MLWQQVEDRAFADQEFFEGCVSIISGFGDSCRACRLPPGRLGLGWKAGWTKLVKLEKENHPLVFKQEYLAEFVDWAGVAFFAIDKMLESLIVDKSIKVDSLLLGDKNALVVAARISGYGSSYKTAVTCPIVEQMQSMNLIFKVSHLLKESSELNDVLDKIVGHIFDQLIRIDRVFIGLIDTKTMGVSKVISRSRGDHLIRIWNIVRR
jgi:hypothetical protein